MAGFLIFDKVAQQLVVLAAPEGSEQLEQVQMIPFPLKS